MVTVNDTYPRRLAFHAQQWGTRSDDTERQANETADLDKDVGDGLHHVITDTSRQHGGSTLVQDVYTTMPLPT